MNEGMLPGVPKSQAEIDEEAALWIWRLDSDAATEATRLAFTTWLMEDPRHAMAYSLLSEVWATLGRPVEAKKPSP